VDPNQLFSMGTLPIVIGITQLWKDTFPTMPTWATVAVAGVSAEVLTEAFAYVQHTDYVIGAILGIVTWLSAMGTFSAVRSLARPRITPTPPPPAGR
jgi:hypothetical protein